MKKNRILKPRRLRFYSRADFGRIPQLERLDPDHVLAMKAVSAVLPFRVNSYVLDELIDWDNVPDDPMFQLTFPQPGMLDPNAFELMRNLVARDAPKEEIEAAAREIQGTLNPHPAGQMELNVPRINGEPVPGMQHKYRETVLFFPMQGQTCHAYCTYCFRWAQFVGLEDLKFASREAEVLADYLREHEEVNSVLFTGGDPMIMNARQLRAYIEPLLGPGLEHIDSIRIGSKSLAYWPYRVLTDNDAADVLKLFEEVAAVKSLAFMAHYSHPVELSTPQAQEALRAVSRTGAVVRCQAPLIRHVNDDAKVWAEMWRAQVQLGAVPYYMFVERDTGAKNYFEVPLARAYKIFSEAYSTVSGLGRTVRGPSMSATPGKVLIDGVTEIQGEKVFVLKMIQGRDPAWVNRVFFAKYDNKATWLRQLKPAFGEKEFFYRKTLDRLYKEKCGPLWEENIPDRQLMTIYGRPEWE